jgi:inosose dehydratase
VGEQLDIAARLAAAPISWGVCEVPGWGLQLAPERVLAEMSSLGIAATELGPTGYLGADPAAVTAALDEFGMHLVGGFVPLALHDRSQRPTTITDAQAAAAVLGAAGASVFVTAVVMDEAWSPRRPLTDDEWAAMFEGFDRVDEICAEHGLVQVLHPHVNTLVETADDVERVLAGSSVHWCLDTGHLQIGGTDPVAFARDHHDRVAHVHIKDIVLEIASRLNAKELSLMEATQEGLFCAAGDGDVAIADCIRVLEDAGYRGWYVLEQDVALTGAEPPAGSGPIEAVRKSVTNLARMTG